MKKLLFIFMFVLMACRLYFCTLPKILIMSQYHIVLFGAGKSASVLIDFLKQKATEKNWKIVIADANEQVAKEKVGHHDLVMARGISLENETERKALVSEADVVISLMPPHLHRLLALDCLELGKHLLTASYVDDEIRQLHEAVKAKDILFLYEMGLDPGIDHMSAMQLIHQIQKEGGVIHTFHSHCGGLVAPESDNNPWHYKISWNPRNILLAGKAGAIFKSDNHIIQTVYENLFNANQIVAVPGMGDYGWYANRDSLSYISTYHLECATDFMRTTLRHPDFIKGWKCITEWKLTDEVTPIQTERMSYAQFFQTHININGTKRWKKIVENPDGAILSADEEIVWKQLLFLGIQDNTSINKGESTAADILQSILENKLALSHDDKDMIIMLHEIKYTKHDKEYEVKSSLVVKGNDSIHTAMAKTVGLPLGIAASLLLEGKINERGVHIPAVEGIYTPVLKELENHDICFQEIDIEWEVKEH